MVKQETTAADIGLLLKREIAKSGRSYRSIATEYGCTRQYVSRICVDGTMSLKVIGKFASILNVKTEVLIS